MVCIVHPGHSYYDKLLFVMIIMKHTPTGGAKYGIIYYNYTTIHVIGLVSKVYPLKTRPYIATYHKLLLTAQLEVLLFFLSLLHVSF